ncbi:MAG: MotA/TolQ/ExbB proton channel family protein [Armatimonadota bacterium]|nr:MotA/TolQ/ExbB proton channel family protein [Armatimonadota bacterium]
MSIAALLGLFLAAGALIANWRLNGCCSKDLTDLPALLLVTVGASGAAIASSNVRTLSSIPRALSHLRSGDSRDPAALVRMIVSLAQLVRVEGLLSLERILPDMGSGFLRKGIELVLDGKPSHVIREILETEMLVSYQRLIAVEGFFQTLGFLAPSFGAVASVSSLSTNLSHVDAAGKLSSAVASSLCGVLYGLLLRSFICVPVSRKLRSTAEEELIAQTMLIEGVLSLNGSENPRTVQDRMSAFLHSGELGDLPIARRSQVNTQARTGLFQRRVT